MLDTVTTDPSSTFLSPLFVLSLKVYIKQEYIYYLYWLFLILFLSLSHVSLNLISECYWTNWSDTSFPPSPPPRSLSFKERWSLSPHRVCFQPHQLIPRFAQFTSVFPLTHSHSLTLTHLHSLTHTHSHSHSHSLTHTHSHSLTLTHSHSHSSILMYLKQYCASKAAIETLVDCMRNELVRWNIHVASVIPGYLNIIHMILYILLHIYDILLSLRINFIHVEPYRRAFEINMLRSTWIGLG